MQHAILHGEHELTIDDKSRVLVPAEIRKSIDPVRDGEAFFVVIGKNDKVWLYAEKYYEHLVSNLHQELTPDEDALEFDQYHFAMAKRVEWDKQGRMQLPTKILKETNTGRDVTVIGTRDHLELWNRAEWQEKREKLKAKRQAMNAKSSPPSGS